jgi:TorA maturation chaperone TorD
MVGDRDLLAFRQGYYDLFVSLLWREPPGLLVTALAGGIGERTGAARNVHSLLAEGWEEIRRFLEAGEGVPEAVADEYTRLLIGPHHPQVYLYESYYLTGRLLDRPLAVIRGFLREIGIEREEGSGEPEDFLPFELEVMRRLIARQAAARDPDGEARWLDSQDAFLKRHLLVWGPAAARDLAEARGAVFYRGVGKLLQGFLELELELFGRWGAEEVRSLEAARRGFARSGEWTGPLFEGGAHSPPGPGAKEQ